MDTFYVVEPLQFGTENRETIRTSNNAALLVACGSVLFTESIEVD